MFTHDLKIYAIFHPAGCLLYPVRALDIICLNIPSVAAIALFISLVYGAVSGIRVLAQRKR